MISISYSYKEKSRCKLWKELSVNEQISYYSQYKLKNYHEVTSKLILLQFFVILMNISRSFFCSRKMVLSNGLKRLDSQISKKKQDLV